MVNPGNVEKISIFVGPGNLFTVIIDGRIYDSLTWDEMLGQVAATTLTGRPHYTGYTIGDQTKGTGGSRRPNN